MNRRSFLCTALTGVTLGSTGCIGGGSKIVTNVQKKVEVPPGTGWVKEVPDVSDNGGAVSYIAKSTKKFDVYFFEGQDDYSSYNEYTSGHAPGDTPTTPQQSMSSGNQEVGETATKIGKNAYKAATKENGGRQPIEKKGPYFFVVDHSNYPAAGGAFPKPHPNEKPCKVNLQLTVSKQRFGL